MPKFQTPMDSYIAFEAKTGLTVDIPDVKTQEDSQVMEDVTTSKDPTEEGNTKFEAWLAPVENFGAQTAAQLFCDLAIGVYDEDISSRDSSGSSSKLVS